MKLKFYLLPLLFLFSQAKAQDCSTLSFTYTAAESRCVATGSFTITVTGGSGNYNFKAVGPITTPTTSSNIITGLPTGYYNLFVTDLNLGCTKEIDSAFIPGSYSDPRFQLTKTDVSCAGNDGSISIANQQNGRSPFSYTIISPSPSNVGASNSTGSFSGLVPGEYFVQLQDSCGGIQVRRITIDSYSWWFDAVNVTKIGCDSVDVFIRLKDNHGNIDTSGTGFSGFSYGVSRFPGDTTWFSNYDFHFRLGTRRNLTIVVKDACGNLHSTTWYVPDNLKPTIGSPSITNLLCNTFNVSLSGVQNIPNPQYCLVNSVTSLNVSCNTTGIFTNVPYGSYCISVYDDCYDTTITTCFIVNHAVPQVDQTVAISNQNCTTFTATITGQVNLTSPSFCLYDSLGNQLNCNSTGIFNNVPYGSYCIKTHDACTDSIITRCFTALKPLPILTGYNISGANCSTFNVSVSGSYLNNPNYCLYDSLGNVITCDSSGVFNGLNHGHYCIRAISCGDTSNSICFTSTRPIPSVGAAVITQQNCSGISVAITGQANLTSPYYCLYDSLNNLISCDSTGAFNNIPYGSYCIKVHDACTDTTITRCFSQWQTMPSINNTIQILSSDCNNVSIQVVGSNLTTPTYCLYDSTNTQVACNSTGIFNSIPYGHYCVQVHDGCVDTTMQVCQTFTPVRGITVTTSKSCTIGTGNVNVLFANGNAPYTVKVYYPNGSQITSVTSSSNPVQIQLNAPSGVQYTIVASDNCHNRDTAYVTPDANIVTKQTTVVPKCPSATWPNGSGDIVASYSSNSYAVIPQIIKKNGSSYVVNYSSNVDTVFTFSDLEPAQYIVQYTQQSCNSVLYDTVTVPTYTYPSQGRSAIYQCDNSGFTVSSNVQGGVSPFTYQIIGSTPDSPDISTSVQNSPVFSINNGTTYSLVRLRSIDACGNATLNDVSVLPLQNISISASATCFYQNITLSVDTVPNATYLWYRKTTPTDSTLLDSGLTYNLPFFLPEQAGNYICKMIINDGCLVRQTNFALNGGCYFVLANAIQLNGRTIGKMNQLSWTDVDKQALRYIVERKTARDRDFVAIVSLPHNGSSYFFNDNNPPDGNNNYRLKIIYADKFVYSNTVNLYSGENTINVYPNPAKDVIYVTLKSNEATDYQIEFISVSGQIIFNTQVKNITSTTLNYSRNRNWLPGMYLIRITDQHTGKTEIRKIVFE